MVSPLAGTVAMVTGGGRGIGRAIAVALARSGAAVSVVARTESELRTTCSEAEAAGGRALPVPADVTSEVQVEHAVRETERSFGGITLLVNNAGSGRCIGPVWECDAGEWWRDFEVNVRGVFLCTRAVLSRMVPRKRGRIVNISSAAGNMTLPMTTSYACSKAAVQRLTDSVAVSVKDHGIAVFAVSPGPTHTAMTEHILQSPEGRRWMPDFQRIPENQWTPPEKIGELVARLALGEADRLSGRFIHIRDDLHALVERADDIVKDDNRVLRLRL